MYQYEDQLASTETNQNHQGVLPIMRRVISVSLHPGTVNTNILSWLSYTGSFSRSADEAGQVLLYAVLDNKYLPGSYINSMLGNHDFIQYRQLYFPLHMKVFPSVKQLPVFRVSRFRMDIAMNSIGLQYSWNQKLQLIVPPVDPLMMPELAGMNNSELAVLVGERLWDVSEQIIEDWEAGRSLFSTPVTVSRMLSIPVVSDETPPLSTTSAVDQQLVLSSRVEEIVDTNEDDEEEVILDMNEIQS